MDRFRVRLDTKSLYFNIFNDNEKGHTATVATVMKQGSVTSPSLDLLRRSSSNIPLSNEALIYECTKNSKSSVRISNVLVFDKIFLNGENILVDASFCMYLKEEVDPTKIQFGRIKLHYPLTLRHSSFQFNVDNRAVINAISKRLHNYAFLIKGVEIFQESGKINFLSTIIGPNQIPYSKVFLNYKGDASQKFSQVFNEVADNYEIEVATMRELGIPGIERVDPSTYGAAYAYCKERAIKVFLEALSPESREAAQIDTDAYPYDLCDVETFENGKKRYFIICFTTTMQNYFFLSLAKTDFLYDFSDECEIILVKNVLSSSPIVQRYDWASLRNMKKDFEVIKYSYE